MIHKAVPQSRPVVIAIFTHISKTYEKKSLPVEIVALAEWIIDDSCIVVFFTLEGYEL